MKLLILLLLSHIAFAAFCTNGEYQFSTYNYFNCQNFTTSVRSFSNTNVFDESRAKTSIAIDDLQIGDLVEGKDGQFSRITNITYTQIIPQIFQFRENIRFSEYRETMTYSANLLPRHTVTFADSSPWMLSRTFLQSVSENEALYQFGLVKYAMYSNPETSINTESVNCQCCDGNWQYFDSNTFTSEIYSDIFELSSLMKLMMQYDAYGFGCKTYNNIIIPSCDAIELTTESGFISVNGMLFSC